MGRLSSGQRDGVVSRCTPLSHCLHAHSGVGAGVLLRVSSFAVLNLSNHLSMVGLPRLVQLSLVQLSCHHTEATSVQ